MAKRPTDTGAQARARQSAKDWLAAALLRTPGPRGDTLKRKREALGLTQKEVGRHLQARRPGRHGDRTVHQHTLSAIESEEIPMPRGWVRVYVRGLDAALREKEFTARLRSRVRQVKGRAA